jgi:[ribosomal protein S18]-alanine N-acetyltransferase
MKLSQEKIKKLVEMDALCFDPPINYSYEDLDHYTGKPGALLIEKSDNEGELIAFCLADTEDGNITTIDVHPDHRRKGLGRLLLCEILEKFRKTGVPEAVSQIAVDNIASLQLHKNLGFKIEYILDAYYPDGSSAYELVLPLL